MAKAGVPAIVSSPHGPVIAAREKRFIEKNWEPHIKRRICASIGRCATSITHASIIALSAGILRLTTEGTLRGHVLAAAGGAESRALSLARFQGRRGYGVKMAKRHWVHVRVSFGNRMAMGGNSHSTYIVPTQIRENVPFLPIDICLKNGIFSAFLNALALDRGQGVVKEPSQILLRARDRLIAKSTPAHMIFAYFFCSSSIPSPSRLP